MGTETTQHICKNTANSVVSTKILIQLLLCFAKASLTILTVEVEQSVLVVHGNRIFLISPFGSY